MRDFAFYLTYSEEDLGWQMVCTDVGKNVVPPGVAYPPRCDSHPEAFRGVTAGRTLAEYQLVYIPAGQGSLEMRGQCFPIRPGTLFMLFPDVPHAYHPDSDTGWTELWVGFKGAFPNALLRSEIISADRPVFEPGYKASMLNAFEEIFTIVSDQAPLYQFRACAATSRLLANLLSETRRAAQQDNSERIVEQVKAYADAAVGESFDLQYVCELVRLNAIALNRVFSAYTGLTPMQYSLHVKINLAKKLLCEERMSVKEVSWRVGFADPYYFSRLFKKKVGVSPSTWSEPPPSAST